MDDDRPKRVGCDCYLMCMPVYGKLLHQFSVLCWMHLYIVLQSGWNDATTGPLIPIIQARYNIGFIVVSMLFVSNCVGYLSAAVINIHLTDRLGFGKVILLGGVLQILAYAVLAPAPPFPVICISYAINGFGISLHNAQANGFVAELPKNTSAKLGLLHAGYGAGAFIAPLVATQFAQIPRWSLHYLTSLGISLANSIALFVVFRLRQQHEVMETPGPHADTAGTSRNDENIYGAVFSSRAVQLLAIFSWVYVGTEVTVGGWIVTFIIEERGGGASAGYVSSGFFGTFGRLNAWACGTVMGKQENWRTTRYLPLQCSSHWTRTGHLACTRYYWKRGGSFFCWNTTWTNVPDHTESCIRTRSQEDPYGMHWMDLIFWPGRIGGFPVYDWCTSPKAWSQGSTTHAGWDD
ncbi:MFS transporter [Rhizoctonia solani 123E]|uniref:MFS transporter n=1 Tax=Rhizoctonia solani 123E TaxID=1423351 RepID=A0A074S8W2_9AGAM|nr:MFS transporter [Rhizoctonia solani 123E]